MVKEKQERLIKKLSELSTLEDLPFTEFISTGSYALNKIITGSYDKGAPIGGIVQLKGLNSSGKTLFALSILAQSQKLGYFCKMIDTENSMNRSFATKMGINPDKLFYSTPETLEEMFDDVVTTIESIRAEDKKTPIVIVLDSLAVLPCKKEIERLEFESDPMDGAWSKLTGAGLRRISGLLRKNKVSFIVINQIRSKVGVIYGSPDVIASGGRALEFYLHVDLETKSNKTSDIIRDDKKNPIGIKGRIHCNKNKCGVPYRECDFEMNFETGLNPYCGLTDLLVEDGYLTGGVNGRYQIGETKFTTNQFIPLLLDKNNSDFAIIRQLLNIQE